MFIVGASVSRDWREQFRPKGYDTRTPTYKSWQSMRNRVRQDGPNNGRYFKLGITVCDRWQEYNYFLADLGERPPGTTLDRENTHGNYEPNNCRWATGSQQQRNKTNTRKFTVNGVTKTSPEWAEHLGVSLACFRERAKRLGAEKAVAMAGY